MNMPNKTIAASLTTRRYSLFSNQKKETLYAPELCQKGARLTPVKG